MSSTLTRPPASVEASTMRMRPWRPAYRETSHVTRCIVSEPAPVACSTRVSRPSSSMTTSSSRVAKDRPPPIRKLRGPRGSSKACDSSAPCAASPAGPRSNEAPPLRRRRKLLTQYSPWCPIAGPTRSSRVGWVVNATPDTRHPRRSPVSKSQVTSGPERGAEAGCAAAAAGPLVAAATIATATAAAETRAIDVPAAPRCRPSRSPTRRRRARQGTDPDGVDDAPAVADGRIPSVLPRPRRRRSGAAAQPCREPARRRANQRRVGVVLSMGRRTRELSLLVRSAGSGTTDVERRAQGHPNREPQPQIVRRRADGDPDADADGQPGSSTSTAALAHEPERSTGLRIPRDRAATDHVGAATPVLPHAIPHEELDAAGPLGRR